MMEQAVRPVPHSSGLADFGCGLLQLLFGPDSPEVAAALQFAASASCNAGSETSSSSRPSTSTATTPRCASTRLVVLRTGESSRRDLRYRSVAMTALPDRPGRTGAANSSPARAPRRHRLCRGARRRHCLMRALLRRRPDRPRSREHRHRRRAANQEPRRAGGAGAVVETGRPRRLPARHHRPRRRLLHLPALHRRPGRAGRDARRIRSPIRVRGPAVPNRLFGRSGLRRSRTGSGRCRVIHRDRLSRQGLRHDSPTDPGPARHDDPGLA